MVTEYSVPYAAFAALIASAWLVVSPYLPAYAEASAQGDWQWIRRRAMQANAITCALLVFGGGFLVLAGPEIIRRWTSGQVNPETNVLVGLACFSLLRAVSNTNGVLLVGLGLVRLAALSYLTVAIVFVFGAWFCLPRYGLVAVPVAGACAHVLDLAITLPYALRCARVKRVDVN